MHYFDYLKSISCFVFAVGLSFYLEPKVLAQTLKVDREFALERHVEVEVTPLGVVLDLHDPISAVQLLDLKEISVNGFDGCLAVTAPCPENSVPPTKLILKKNVPINFPDQISNPEGTTMLYVNTQNGTTYRFTLIPKNSTPKHTLVEIINKPLKPLFSENSKN